jgi:acyl carrier protein
MTQIDETGVAGFISSTLLGGKPVAPEDDLLLSGTLDSLGVMTLVAFLEKETGSTIPAQDITIENFSTVDAICAYLRGLPSLQM